MTPTSVVENLDFGAAAMLQCYSLCESIEPTRTNSYRDLKAHKEQPGTRIIRSHMIDQVRRKSKNTGNKKLRRNLRHLIP
jgi:hypothetical protein